MSDSALEARLEQFSRNYLSSPSPPLDETATAHLRSMLTDAGYRQMEWKHPHRFYARPTQGSAIDLFFEYNVSEKEEGFSYLRAENVFMMREFEKVCAAWLRPQSSTVGDSALGAFAGTVSGFILTIGIGTAYGGTLDKSRFPQWGYWTMLIPAAVGAAIGYFPARTKAERKAEQDYAFLEKYRPLLATDKEAILKALAAA